MKIYEVGNDEKCGGCNWEVGTVYYATESQKDADEMYEENEYGLASHWYYSLMKSGKASDKVVERGFFAPTEKINWVKQLVDWQKKEADSDEFIRAVKFDALAERIFVFSPKGDVFDLPINASPVDYAFAVHTDLGAYIKAAKVNGKMIPLSYKLKSSDVVEIIKSKEKRKPSHDWLEFVVTTEARREIEKHLRKEGLKS